MALLVDLGLEGSLNLLHFFIAAKGFLDPADHGRFVEFRVRDEVVGALEADTTIRRTGIGIVRRGNGIVRNHHKSVIGLTFQGADTPSKVGGHGKNRVQ